MIWCGFPEGGFPKDGKLMPLRPGIGMLLEHYLVPTAGVRPRHARLVAPGTFSCRGRDESTSRSENHSIRTSWKKGERKNSRYERITNALHDEMVELHQTQG